MKNDFFENTEELKKIAQKASHNAQRVSAALGLSFDVIENGNIITLNNGECSVKRKLEFPKRKKTGLERGSKLCLTRD